MKVTPENITKLEPTDIFVFGSNEAGEHIGGAARIAREKFMAQNGIEEGITGQCYAIPTLDHKYNQLPLKSIERAVNRFGGTVLHLPSFNFLLTPIGCGIAGFTPEQIAPLFRPLWDMNPKNLTWPQSFINVLSK